MTTIHQRFNLGEAGQALLETVVIVPLFVLALGAFLTLAVAYGWRDSTASTATLLRLSVTPQHRQASVQDTERLRILKDLSNKTKSSLRQQQGPGQIPRQALFTTQQRSDSSCTSSGPAPAPRYGHLELCLQGDDILYAKPHPNNPAARFTPLLRRLLQQGHPTLQDTLTPVFDNMTGFRRYERTAWHKRVHARQQYRLQPQAFARRIALGGKERSSGPFNLTRDCLFSAQGKDCIGTQARQTSELEAAFRTQRRLSFATQLGLCTAEGCRHAPHPATCALVAAAALASSSASRAPDKLCPLTVSGVRVLHAAKTTALRGFQIAETLEYSKDLVTSP